MNEGGADSRPPKDAEKKNYRLSFFGRSLFFFFPLAL